MSRSKVKQPVPSPIVIEPATAKRWPDVKVLFADHGDRGCWCQYWRLSSSEYSNGEPGSGRANLQRQVTSGPSPGMIAYVDGVPAGWLGFWPRKRMERLVRSRAIPEIDDLPVWAIVCFMVRAGYRRKGVATALLKGAIAYARATDIPALEAYPMDSESKRVDVAHSYVGFTAMFKSAGFQSIVETEARSAKRPRILMRLDLRNVQRLIREATLADIDAMFDIRTSVHENAMTLPQLNNQGIDKRSVAAAITDEGRGWVAEDNGMVVGFSIADSRNGSIFAMFVRPEFEGRGHGSRLLNSTVSWLFSCGFDHLWLATAPDTRAHFLYLKHGWRETGEVEPNGDVRMELIRHQGQLRGQGGIW